MASQQQEQERDDRLIHPAFRKRTRSHSLPDRSSFYDNEALNVTPGIEAIGLAVTDNSYYGLSARPQPQEGTRSHQRPPSFLERDPSSSTTLNDQPPHVPPRSPKRVASRHHRRRSSDAALARSQSDPTHRSSKPYFHNPFLQPGDHDSCDDSDQTDEKSMRSELQDTEHQGQALPIPDPSKEPFPRPGQDFVRHHRKEKRRETFMDEVPVEERIPNKYLFRRPRALQVEHRGHILDMGDEGTLNLEHPESHYSSIAPLRNTANGGGKQHHPESLKKHRERLDLFVDLVFVGVISNISEHFFEEAFVDEVSSGASLGHFILLYLPAWRIWAALQNFLNSYFMDDMAQRLLVVWILALAITWGNNAPYFINNIDVGNNGGNFLILAYILAILSVSAVEIFYSIWIPWLRKMFFAAVVIGVPSIVLWVLTTVVNAPDKKIWLLVAAIVYDSCQNILIMSPITDKLASGDNIRKTVDVRHTTSRYENFFIIALGEGLFLLIRGSPLGQGISEQLGRGIIGLLIYFYLAFTYFHGDMSKTYVHALYRRWWIKYLWYSIHVPLYGALIMLSSGILYLVEFHPETDIPETVPEGGHKRLMARAGGAGPKPKFDDHTLHVATATMCADMAVILFCQLVIGVLNRSLDSKHELWVGNKYIRMAPRVLGIITLAFVWIPHYEDATEVLGIVLIIVFLVSGWEFIAGLDRHARVFEPIHAWGLTQQKNGHHHEKA